MDSQTQPEVLKPERKVVIARYWVDEAFKVPDGIDLENKKQVKNWRVEPGGGALYIDMVDGTTIKVKSQNWIDDCEYAHPEDSFIENASEFGLDSDDEDSDDEEEDGFEDCDSCGYTHHDKCPRCERCEKYERWREEEEED